MGQVAKLQRGGKDGVVPPLGKEREQVSAISWSVGGRLMILTT